MPCSGSLGIVSKISPDVHHTGIQMHKNSAITANMNEKKKKRSYGNSLSHLELIVSQRKVAI